jgi:hypothetical protein
MVTVDRFCHSVANTTKHSHTKAPYEMNEYIYTELVVDPVVLHDFKIYFCMNSYVNKLFEK